MSTTSDAGAPATGVERSEMAVLLAGRDPEELRAYVAPLVDREDVTVTVEADEEAAIEQVRAGGLDCLVATYDPSSGQGMQLLDHVRADGTDVPIILLPSTQTTVIDSRNFVVDVASVVEPGESLARGGLADDVVHTVERKRSTEAARRRDEMEAALRRVARDAARADAVDEVPASVAERFGDSPAVDAAWVVAAEDGAVDVRATAGEGELPADARAAVVEAVRGALTVEGPRVASRGDHAFAAVPIETPGSEQWAVTLAAESRYAFAESETRVLAELRDTLARSLAAVERGRSPMLGAESRAAFEALIQRLDVPVIAYGEAGWIATASRGFADLVGTTTGSLPDRPVWDVLPEPRLETFGDYWASFDRGDARTATVDLGGVPRHLVTTRVAVDGAPVNVALVVEPSAGGDAWLAEVLAYELRHWLGIAGETGGDDAALSKVADHVESALETETAASGDAETHVTPQPIGQVASEAWAHVLGTAGDSEVRGGRTVLADRTILFRLFAHLFRTLLTYGDASAVDVGVFDGGFFVEDDGAGVHHADRSYAESATMTDAKSGASIRVARRLAKRHGWELSVQANDAGGSRFVVRGLRDGKG